MATSTTYPRLDRAALLSQRKDRKRLRLIQVGSSYKPAGVQRLMMTKAEAEVFFAACEAPYKAEINLFEHLPTVAKWFRD